MSAEELVTLPLAPSKRDYQAGLGVMEALTEEHPVEVDIARKAGNDELGIEVPTLGTLPEKFDNCEPQDALDDTIEDCYRLPELENLALANIELSNGSEDDFMRVQAEEETGRIEIMDAGTEDKLLDDGLRPVTAFQCFSPHPGNLFLD